MKNNLVFLVSLIGFLIFASFVSAAIITLPNPLCLIPPVPPVGTPPGTCIPSPTCICSFASLISAVTTYIVYLVGLIAVIMFVWAGILFVTSTGNPGKIEQARKAVIWAVVGLAIVLAGSGLVAVIQAVIGTPPPASP